MASVPAAHREPLGAWVWFLAAAFLVCAGYLRLATSEQSFVDNVVAVASAGAMFGGIARHRPEPRFAWLLLAFGVLLFALGDIVYGTSQPVPSPADMLYVAGYPVLGLGLLALARSKVPGLNDSKAIDAIGLAGGIALVGLVVLVVPTGRPHEADVAGKVLAMAYPVGDLTLLAIMARPIRSATARGMPVVLIGAALALRFAGDVGFAGQEFGTAYSVGSALDLTWLLSFACLGAAALHPGIRNDEALAWTRASGWGAALAGAYAVVPVAAEPNVLETLSTVAATSASAERSVGIREARRRHLVRFRVVIAWVGVVLLAMAGATLLAGRAAGGAESLLLAGAYGTTGSFVLIASAVRA
jgi:uncharacterized membrane protein